MQQVGALNFNMGLGGLHASSSAGAGMSGLSYPPRRIRELSAMVVTVGLHAWSGFMTVMLGKCSWLYAQG